MYEGSVLVSPNVGQDVRNIDLCGRKNFLRRAFLPVDGRSRPAFRPLTDLEYFHRRSGGIRDLPLEFGTRGCSATFNRLPSLSSAVPALLYVVSAPGFPAVRAGRRS